MKRWLLCDFAGVIGEHQSSAAKDAMVGTADADPSLFWAGYWSERTDYDGGILSSVEYWTMVGRRAGATWSHATIRELVRLDIQSWLVPNPESLRLAQSFADRGGSLALLSNAPHDLADAIERLDWMSNFRPMLFSCRIGSVKPTRAIYRAALSRLAAEPGDVIFIDDRETNVRGAADIGMRARLFTDPASLEFDLQVE